MSNDHGYAMLGCSEHWLQLFQPYVPLGLSLGRVVRADRASCLVGIGTHIFRAQSSTRLAKAARSAVDLPACGDWVVVSGTDPDSPCVIEAILPRRTAVTRGDPGKATAGQVLAANVDMVFVVHPLGGEPNLRRIERELAVAWESGAQPAVILSKADLSADAEADAAKVEAVALAVPVITVSVTANNSVDQISALCSVGQTAALIGPSGAGKSTLVNALLGHDRQATREVRVADGKGRHTTVARELIQIPGGGILVDTPGLRALAVWDADEGIALAFSDIEELAASCRFSDCTHSGEPGCAVAAAVSRGELPADRLESFQKLQRESARMAIMRDARLKAEERKKVKSFHRQVRAYHRLTRRSG